MTGLEKRGRETRRLVVPLLMSALCGLPLAPAVPAGADTLVVSPDTSALHRDTTATRRAPRKTWEQMLAEADSAIAARGGSRADSAQLFLSWDAPWGSKRARRTRMPACDDSTREDTLYLCLKTGQRFERFAGFTCELYVRATGADTLGPWWRMQGKGGLNPGSMRAEWANAQNWDGFPQPFTVMGVGHVAMETERSRTRLRMIYAVPMDQAEPVVADAVYTLARIIITHHPERRLAGCTTPVVFEWAQAALTLGPRDDPSVARGERFVTYGGPYQLVEPYRAARPKPWKPVGTKPN